MIVRTEVRVISSLLPVNRHEGICLSAPRPLWGKNLALAPKNYRTKWARGRNNKGFGGILTPKNKGNKLANGGGLL